MTKKYYKKKIFNNKKWKFFSDHLPIGVRISKNSKNVISIVTCNVLNKKYIKYIKRNTQFLNNSIITKENGIQIKNSKLNLREKRILDWIVDKMKKKIILICLQEVSSDLLKVIQQYISNFEVYNIVISNEILKNKEIVLYVKEEIKVNEVVGKLYEKNNFNTITSLNCFNNHLGNFFIINTHVKFGKENILDNFLKKLGSNSKVIVAGDFNIDSKNFRNKMKYASTYFVMTNQYYTHINAQHFNDVRKKISKFDYILKSKNFGVDSSPMSPKELGCESDLKLLNNFVKY